MVGERIGVAFDQPRPRSAESLRSLLAVMQCPVTGEELELEANGTLRTTVSARVWPAIGYRPIMFEGLEPKIFPPEHYSNSLAPQARAIITSTDGLVLNLSAGGSADWFPNVVEAEAAIFRNTDIVADAHRLPFKDDVFAAVIAMNAFEHYHSPPIVAREIHRILKEGGEVFLHTAFLQPLHEPPYHFYNCTEFGLRKWFEGFEEIALTVSENFNPVYALSWTAAELDGYLRASGDVTTADAIADASLRELADVWRDPQARSGPLYQAFSRLPMAIQRRMAAGFEFHGAKKSGGRLLTISDGTGLTGQRSSRL